MRVAITGAAGCLGRVLLHELAGAHQMRASDTVAHAADAVAPAPEPPDGSWGDGGRLQRADVLNPEDMARLCDGAEAVVHLASAAWCDDLDRRDNEARILDTRLKGTRNVLQAAVDAGVRRVVQISDLGVYSGYGDEWVVSEDFVPLPDTSAAQQAAYLSELIAREYARLSPGLVVTLRLGSMMDAGSLPAGAAFRPEWVDRRDAVTAILRALELDGFDGLAHWGLYNLAADVPGSRYSLLKIRGGRFAFTPAESFARWRGEAQE